MSSLTEVLQKLCDLLDQGVDVRFIKDGASQDINLTQDHLGQWAISVNVSSEIENDGQVSIENVIAGDDGEDSFTAVAGTRVYGFLIAAIPRPCDCIVTLYINNKFVGYDVLSADNRRAYFYLDKPIPANAGEEVKVVVTNIHTTSTSSYVGIIFHEVIRNVTP